MIPTDDPLKCPYAEEWDRRTLGEAIETFLWTSGKLQSVKCTERVRVLDRMYHF